MRFNVTWPQAWRSETRPLRNLVIQRIALIKGDETMRSAQLRPVSIPHRDVSFQETETAVSMADMGA